MFIIDTDMRRYLRTTEEPKTITIRRKAQDKIKSGILDGNGYKVLSTRKAS